MNKNILILIGMVFSLALMSVGHADTTPLATIRLEVDNLLGDPISSIMPGGSFLLKVFAQDDRTTSPIPNSFGVFSAYANVSYDPNFASINGPITFDPFFGLTQFANTSQPGGIDAGGARVSLTPPGSAEQRVFSVPFHANSAGSELFASSFSNSGDFLVYGYDSNVHDTEIQFLSTSLTIVPEPSSFALGAICSLLVLARCALRRRPARAFAP